MDMPQRTTDVTLYGVGYSPWTERARWALDHHGIGYRYSEHIPMLGEPLLRLRGRRAGRAKATAPLLVHAGGAIGDSLEIMRYADAHGRGASLGSDTARAAAWAEEIEQGLAAGRARLTAAIITDPEALRESVLPVSPAPLSGLLRPVAAQAARFVAKKYGADLARTDEHIAVQRRVCLALRDALRGRAYIEGDTLGAADVLAATYLQMVEPVTHPRIVLLPALRRAWTAAPLVDEFADLLAWRDALYANARGTRAKRAA
jgi:glutathione S-transferase